MQQAWEAADREMGESMKRTKTKPWVPLLRGVDEYAQEFAQRANSCFKIRLDPWQSLMLQV